MYVCLMSVCTLNHYFTLQFQMVELAIKLELHNALNILLRYARRHAVKPPSTAALTEVASSEDWHPTSGQVAAAVLAALSAFLSAPSGKVVPYSLFDFFCLSRNISKSSYALCYFETTEQTSLLFSGDSQLDSCG